MRFLLIILLVAGLALLAGCENASDGVPDEGLPVMGRVDQSLSVDGSSAEYPAAPAQVLGSDIHMAHEGNYFYIHIQMEAGGWVAVGLNNRGGGMDGSNMIIGFIEEGTPVFRDDVGRGRNHSEANTTAVDDFFFSYEDGTVIMEFSYPLMFPDGEGYNIAELTPGETYTLIVARHSTSSDASRQHTDRGAINFTVEP